MAHSNPFLLAADNSPHLLPLLRSKPDLASSQDEHGYSLVHAAASYNHLDLLRTLVDEFQVNVNTRDEDGETALFVVETVEAARILLEELNADMDIKNAEGMAAEEKIRTEGDFSTVADYLFASRSRSQTGSATGPESAEAINRPPPLPSNVTVNVGTIDTTSQEIECQSSVDPQFRRRIQELAAREDFQGEEGQRELRELVTEAVAGVGSDEYRLARRRLE